MPDQQAFMLPSMQTIDIPSWMSGELLKILPFIVVHMILQIASRDAGSRGNNWETKIAPALPALAGEM